MNLTRPGFKSRIRTGTLLLHYAGSGIWIWLSAYLFWEDWRGIFWLFFLVGGPWLGVALYQTFALLKYRNVRLRIAGRVWPGGKLVADLQVPSGIESARKLAATLACKQVSIMTTVGPNQNSRGVYESVIWSWDAEFPLIKRLGRSECRIDFDLPDDMQYTTSQPLVGGGQSLGTFWDLSVHADVPGVDLKCSFVVPVGARPPGKIDA
jgi:hypothetical protein